jgi:hypothetical protein
VIARRYETDSVPAHWPAASQDVDEIWVPTRFNALTFAQVKTEISQSQTDISHVIDLSQQPPTTILLYFVW